MAGDVSFHKSQLQTVSQPRLYPHQHVPKQSFKNKTSIRRRSDWAFSQRMRNASCVVLALGHAMNTSHFLFF